MRYKEIIIIGAGLAGTEAAWQIASNGIPVKLVEMRPIKLTPAHHTDQFAELVCSNSFGAKRADRATGLLHEELRIFDSLVLQCADEFSIPAGGALAVDRSKFSHSLTERLEQHPLITIIKKEQIDLPGEDTIIVIATGPLTSNKFAQKIRKLTGIEYCHFFDAASPIIYGDSIDQNKVFNASRYDKGDADYVNCPMDENEYIEFREELISGEQAELKDFEKETATFFEGCLPIEEIARRGLDTMRFGPLKPIGLWNPEWGDLYDRKNRLKKRPHAIVQLRKEDLKGKLLNMVGFQTNLKWSEQKRIFQMIPGLKNAEFVRFGVMHRNTFLESPKLLLPTLQFINKSNVLAAGQITGTEGYAAATAGGLLAGLNASFLFRNISPITFPKETMLGSLINFISNENKLLSLNRKNKFQPMPASFGLMPELSKKIRNKNLRYEAYKNRSLEELIKFKEIINLHNQESKTNIGFNSLR